MEPMQIRRIVTGVDAAGKAVVISDGPTPRVKDSPAISVRGTLVWVTDETPTDLSKMDDPATRESGVAPPAGGSIIRVVDFLPAPTEIDNEKFLEAMGLSEHADEGNRHAFMHRTKSIDYAIVLSGEVDMLLDEGEVHVKAGDILIQRGTNHAWVNRTDEVCRICFVLIDAVDFPPPSARAFSTSPV